MGRISHNPNIFKLVYPPPVSIIGRLHKELLEAVEVKKYNPDSMMHIRGEFIIKDNSNCKKASEDF